MNISLKIKTSKKKRVKSKLGSIMKNIQRQIIIIYE